LGICRTVLILLVALILLPGAAEAARQSACLACHRPHHAGRGSCVGCHRGNDRTERKKIAHNDLIAGRFAHFTLKGSPVVARGEKLMDLLACRRCHISTGRGNRLAANLDRLAPGSAQGIFDAIRAPVLFMPNFHCDDGQISTLVNAILAGGESAEVKVGETAQVVHFEDGKQRRENSFARQCGPCHKALSERFGGVGHGDMGPNLSGLFSAAYPGTYRDGEPWTTDKLGKWLENPRAIRANARMQPLRLTAGEFEQLAETLRTTVGAKP
jgi:cytochrome c2